MIDNKTAHMALEYQAKIGATIPNYDIFHSQTIDLVRVINPTPEKWLDTGCGTGNFVLSAGKEFINTQFVLADPSTEMLDIARTKLEKTDDQKYIILEPVSSQDIQLTDEHFHVITALQAHHYLDRAGRKTATDNCYRMIKTGGVFITFENIRPLTDVTTTIGLKRWQNFQVEQGKDPVEAEKHINRFGVEYLPITILEHLELLKETGFAYVDLFWFSYMQAGFYAIK
jgi:tRNA (cmo5U34)-methyltransferase